MDVGTTNLPAALKSDIARRTTQIPQFIGDDFNSSLTLSPTPINDADTPNLGYHYPLVHFAVNGATINSCTLNIDQGTVLALEGFPYWWALRVNPGGRLNANGYPTNRVVFAHLEAIQESPVPDMQPSGQIITFKEIPFSSGPVFPLPPIDSFHCSSQSIGLIGLLPL